VLLGDAYIGYNLLQVLFPFTTQGDDIFWVGIGQLSLYFLGALVLSFYVRQWIGMKVWRAVHYLSFFTYILFMLHSIFSGTDTQSLAWLYWLTAGSLGVLVTLRLTLQLDSWLFVDEKCKRPVRSKI
jgi:predicted ferric reductase